MDSFKADIKAEFETLGFPAPYCYEYSLNLICRGTEILVKYKLNYLDRDELGEEEILMEGFTLNDDFKWEGKIENLWIDDLTTLLNETKLDASIKKGAEGKLELKLIQDDKELKGHPDNAEKWIYLLQEIIQAVYETAEKESPFELTYLNIENGKTKKVKVVASFKNRNVKLDITKDQIAQTKELPWDQLSPLIKLYSVLDYYYDQAIYNEPTKDGAYLETGVEEWYKMGKGVANPDKKSKALENLKGIFDKILEEN